MKKFIHVLKYGDYENTGNGSSSYAQLIYGYIVNLLGHDNFQLIQHYRYTAAIYTFVKEIAYYCGEYDYSELYTEETLGCIGYNTCFFVSLTNEEDYLLVKLAIKELNHG